MLTAFGTGMATVIGRSDSAETALLRRALDEGGFADGADRYGVHVVDDLRAASGVADDRPAGAASCRADAETDGVWGLLARGVEDVISWTGKETVGDRPGAPGAVAGGRPAAVVAARARPLVHGRSSAMRRLLVDLVELAAYGSGPILLVGETGTGKELAARLVHAVAESSSSLVVVDCTTIVAVAVRQRALRSREGSVHRGRPGPRGRVRGSGRRHPVPRRDRRAAPWRCRPSCSGCCRKARSSGSAATRGHGRASVWSAPRTGTSRASSAQGRFRSDLYHRIASGVVPAPAPAGANRGPRGAVRALPRRGGRSPPGRRAERRGAAPRPATSPATSASCGSWRTPSRPGTRGRVPSAPVTCRRATGPRRGARTGRVVPPAAGPGRACCPRRGTEPARAEDPRRRRRGRRRTGGERRQRQAGRRDARA